MSSAQISPDSTEMGTLQLNENNGNNGNEAEEGGDSRNTDGETQSSETISVPEKGEPSKVSQTSLKDCVLKMLDEMDERVDKLRSDAMKLENERDDILSSLDTLLSAQMIYELEPIDVDEITRYMERLARRSMSVQVDIKTERNGQQLEALHKVNNLIDTMIRQVKSDSATTKRMCLAYINSCSEQLSTEVPTDSVFESAVLGCTIEDQKRVKKRLSGLYTYFQSYGRPTSLAEENEEDDETVPELQTTTS